MYYVVINEVVQGPFGMEELGQMLEDKKILPIDLAVLEGHENWMPLEKLIHIEVDKSPRARTEPAAEVPGHHGSDPHPHGKCNKTCPFCGGKKVKPVTREFQSAQLIRAFSPKVCRQCEAIWTPKIDIGSAFSIFAIGLVSLGVVVILMMPYLLHYLYSNEPRTYGTADYIRWGISAVIFPFAAFTLGKAGRYVASKRARAFKILRHPHPMPH